MWEEKTCALCGAKVQEGDKLGVLLGPLADGKGCGQELYVHRLCALWSPEVYQTEQGTLRNVLAAVRRGRQVRCGQCGRRGATLGCLLERCPTSFHLACAAQAACTFHCSDYTLACKQHARLFPQKPADAGHTPFAPARPPGGSAQPTPGGGGGGGGPGATPGGLLSPPTALPLPKQPGRKRGRHGAMEIYDHMMAARVALKRARREIRAARRSGAESSDDEEHFAKKEAARLARDKARLNPVTLGGAPSAGATAGAGVVPSQRIEHEREGHAEGGLRQLPGARAGAREGPPPPLGLVSGATLRDTDFGSVAGLDSVVAQLREMVLLPLIYPTLFGRMGITPPRGILFYGEPGTGKTLAARALAGACARHSPAPVTFFARKGADCLGKFSGEAERTLRLLFEEASARAPAIIFLDELDALVPARAARAGGSDQIYASVVSTLLSLMDGIADRGNVIVIGATNRPEAIDPALRRPGRFDREVYFGLPGPEQRAAILEVHTRKWPRPPATQLLLQVAGLAEGCAGADLQALCTAAVMAAARRASPALIELAEREAAAAAPAAGAGAGARASAQGVLPGAAGLGSTPAVQRGGGGETGLDATHQVQQQQTQQQQQQQQQDGKGEGAGPLQQLLDLVQVEPRDWWEALAAAPAPCSRRHGLSALSAGAARPLAPHLLPLLCPSLREALCVLHASGLPLPPAAATAAVAAATMSSDAAGGAAATVDSGGGQFEALLCRLGVALPSGAERGSSGGSSAFGQDSGALPGTQLPQPYSAAPAGHPLGPQAAAGRRGAGTAGRGAGSCWVPCRLLLAGEGELGQEQAAGALLKLLEGCTVHTLSLPTAVVEGSGDATAGCVAIVGEALRRASPDQPCVFFLPRLEAWALHQTVVASEELEEGKDEEGDGAPQLAVCNGGGREEAAARARTPHRAGGSEAGYGPGPAAALWMSRAASPAVGCHVGTPSSSKGFPTAPSPFSGLLPLEDRVPNTPSAAHALRAEAGAHRLASFGGGREGGGGCSGVGASPHPQAAPGQQQQPPRQAPRLVAAAAAAAAQTASAAGAALPAAQPAAALVMQQQSLAGSGDVAARTLPRIRTSISPDRAAPGAPAAAPAPRLLAGPSPAALPARWQHEVEEQRQPSDADVEVTQLTQPWSIFESLIKQTLRSQPLLVLATCHAPLASLPPLLLSFFGAGAPAGAGVAAGDAEEPAGAGRQVAAASRRPLGSAGVGSLGSVPGHEHGQPFQGGARGGLVVAGPPGKREWEGSLAAAGEEIVQRVAAHAAATLCDRLEEQQQAQQRAAQQDQGGGARAGGAAAAGAAAAGVAAAAPQPGTPSTAGGGEGVAETPAALAASLLVDPAGAAAAVPPPPGLSRAELSLGLQLVARVAGFIKALGTRLAQDPRCKLASTLVAPRQASGSQHQRGGGSCGGGGRAQEQAILVSFEDVARRAKRGGYATLDDLVADAGSTAGRILAETRGQEGSGRRDPAAAAAAAALLDEVESRCHALRQQLGLLAQPEHARLAAAAAAHVAAVLHELQTQQQRAGERLVGRRLRVFWPQDQAWFEGSVAAFEGGKHWVKYDDGDQEWLELVAEKFELLEGQAHEVAPRAAAEGAGPEHGAEHRQQQDDEGERADVAAEEQPAAGVVDAAAAGPPATEEGEGGNAALEAADAAEAAQPMEGIEQDMGGTRAAQPPLPPAPRSPLQPSQAEAAAAAARSAARSLQTLLCSALSASAAAAAVRHRVQLLSSSGGRSLASLEEAMSEQLVASCAACDAAIAHALLAGAPISEAALQELAEHCAAAILASHR